LFLIVSSLLASKYGVRSAEYPTNGAASIVGADRRVTGRANRNIAYFTILLLGIRRT
jgi:hypothetical protein